MAPRPPRAHRVANREATKTGRPLSNASKVVKHATSKKPQQTRLPIRPVAPHPPRVSAEQPVSFVDDTTTAATNPLQLRPKASQSLSAPTPPALLASDTECDDDSMGSDDDSIGSDYVRIDYVQRRRIVENVEAYSAQFEKCGVSYFKEATFFSKMREFRLAPKQTKRLRDGREPYLRRMVEDFNVQFGRLFWGYESDVETDMGDVDSDVEMETEDEDGDEKMDEDDDTSISEGVYEYFAQMQRLRFKEK